jgi:methylenetetrahydrofolate dehydrogenase (NADP+)/methenyltetrahydrofolate cyclohydrolase
LPKHIDPEKVTERIDHRKKDVDGFHPVNLGRMQRNLPSFIPATPYGITLMLKEYGVDTIGQALRGGWPQQHCGVAHEHFDGA